MSFTAHDIPRDVWDSSFRRFIGPHVVDDRLYGFDGRHEDNAIHFDADFSERSLWTSSDGIYSVRPVSDPDWEPPSTVLLVRNGEDIVGFYADGMLWIDEEHRGRGLAQWLILSGCVAAGRVPYDNSSPMGFSRAGIASHLAAHRTAQRMAMEAGLAASSESIESVPHPSVRSA